jgi:ArsR family transcriptional regulator
MRAESAIEIHRNVPRALASERRLLILKWPKQPKAHFRGQVDGDLVKTASAAC